MTNHDLHKIKKKITHFFNKTKRIQIDTILEINLLIRQLNNFHQMMKNFIIKIINDFIQTKYLVLTIVINQIFLNHTHEMNKYDNLEILQPHTIIFFNHKTQSMHNLTNQLKCITKSHCHVIYNNMK